MLAFLASRAFVLVYVTLVPQAAKVRTGFWGCGAFGGNRTLMTLLQLLADRASQWKSRGRTSHVSSIRLRSSTAIAPTVCG